MRSRLIHTLPILLFSVFLAGCQFNPFAKKAGIQITSHPDANVIINGKSVSKTPFYDENLTPGMTTIQMTAIDSGQSWEGKVNLVSGTLTTVHREFGSTPDKSHSYSLSFEKLANNKDSSVSIISLPSNATVSIDGKPAGFTPATADIAPGPHVFSFTAPGYQDKIINGAVQIGYRLVLNFTMSTMEIVPTPTPTPIATPSATLTPKPTNTISITPLPKQATTSAVVKPYVEQSGR
ncbi:MAG: seg [Microgenomates group bacterium GW2011_GWC1_44_37]|nr:MAG: seg [Microgenomates group bacterium GW2011_GWC1_44_37]